jgi:hypothetical protein
MAKDKICAACGTIGKPKRVTRGSFFIEILLWLCFLVPGLIYTIWRLTTRGDACRACGGTVLLPLDTPGGQAMAARFKAT